MSKEKNNPPSGSRKHKTVKRTKAQAIDQTIGGTTPTATKVVFTAREPDWEYWKKFDLWTLGQAVCLICRSDPEKIESQFHPLRHSHIDQHDSRAKQIRQVFQLAKVALEAGNMEVTRETEIATYILYKKVSPPHFLRWAQGKGLPIPDELCEFIEESQDMEKPWVHETDFRHSPDFRSVYKGGQQFTLSTNEALVFEILYDAYKNDTPAIGQEYILDRLSLNKGRLRDVFKKSPEAFKALIDGGEKKGTFRLKI